MEQATKLRMSCKLEDTGLCASLETLPLHELYPEVHASPQGYSMCHLRQSLLTGIASSDQASDGEMYAECSCSQGAEPFTRLHCWQRN